MHFIQTEGISEGEMNMEKKSATDELIEQIQPVYEVMVSLAFIAFFMKALLGVVDDSGYPLEKAPKEKDSSLSAIKEQLR